MLLLFLRICPLFHCRLEEALKALLYQRLQEIQ